MAIIAFLLVIAIGIITKFTSGGILGEENILEQEAPKLGVESFAYFALEKPSAFYFLGVRNEAKNIIHSAHNSLFDIDESALALGVALQSEIAFNYLTNR